MRVTDLMAPIGCHYYRCEETWEVTVFASLTEIIGGEEDGRRIPSRFVLDVGAIIGLFNDVEEVRWQNLPQGADDELGAHLAVEGIHRGERLVLRIPAKAPDRFEAGRLANVYEMRFVDIW